MPGDEERRSFDCRLSDDEARRSCGFGDLPDKFVRISGRGDLNTGEEGGSGVCDASFKARKGALFGRPRWPFGCAIFAFVDGGAA